MIRLEHRKHITDCTACDYSGPDTRVLVFESRISSNKTTGYPVAVCPACARQVVVALSTQPCDLCTQEIHHHRATVARLEEWATQLEAHAEPGNVGPFIGRELRNRMKGTK
jgi:hypothetical protein